MAHPTRTVQYTTIYCLLLFSIAGVTACKKEKADRVNPPAASADFDITRIWNCHNSSNPYPSQINRNLEGTWVWISNKCFGTNQETFSADKHVVVTFNDGGLFKVFEDSRLVSEGSWKLSHSNDDTWSIVTSSHSAYLNGYVLLCENELVFFSSYLDGCDYYFARSK